MKKFSTIVIIVLVMVLMPVRALASNGQETDEVCVSYRIDPDEDSYPNSSQNVYLNYNGSMSWFYESYIGSSGYLALVTENPRNKTRLIANAMVEAIGGPVDFTINIVSGTTSIPVTILRLEPEFGEVFLGYEIDQTDIERLEASREDILITFSWVPTTPNAQIRVDIATLLICYQTPSEIFKLWLSQIMTRSK